MSDNISVEEEKDQITDIQFYGISQTVVELLSNLKKYIMLTQMHSGLREKNPQIVPIMTEFYQYREMEILMDIRGSFDKFHVYTKDKIILRNSEHVRDQFENAINFLTTNITKTTGNVNDENYSSTLNEFSEMIKKIAQTLSSRPIFDEGFIR